MTFQDLFTLNSQNTFTNTLSRFQDQTWMSHSHRDSQTLLIVLLVMYKSQNKYCLG